MRKRTAVFLTLTVLTAGQVVARQSTSPKQGVSPSPQMSVGILAVASDQAGTLFVDGERKAAVSPRRVITLKLTAGQHFVDLRDTKGSKIWEKVVDVPAGAQVVEKISLGARIGRETVPGNVEQQHSKSPGTPTVDAGPTADDYARSVAAALGKLIETGGTDFEQVRGALTNETNGIKRWQLNAVVPGFECSLNEMRGMVHVYCAADQKAETGENIHLAIARALAEHLRAMDYGCYSEAALPSTISVNPVSIHQFAFRRSGGDMGITQYLHVYTEDGFHRQPPGNFQISFLVYSQRALPTAAVNQPPLECDFSYSALKTRELNTRASAQVAERVESHSAFKPQPAQSRVPVAPIEGTSSDSTIKEAEPSGTPKLKGRTGTLEGYIRDQNGNPLPRASVWIRTGQHLENGDAVIPIVTQRVVGVISIDNPPMAIAENQHLAITDNNGHFRFKASASKYFLTAIAPTEGGLFSPSKFDQSRAKAAKAYIKIEIIEKQDKVEDINLPCERKQIGKRSFICEADSMPTPPESGNGNSSLDATMKFLQTTLNDLGEINFTVYGHDQKTKKDWTLHNSFEVSNVVAEPTSCLINYHVTAANEGKTAFDRDFALSLRGVQNIVVVSAAEDMKTASVNAGTKTFSFRTDPAAFQLRVLLSGNGRSDFIFADEEGAHRAAKAMGHAVELCGRKSISAEYSSAEPGVSVRDPSNPSAIDIRSQIDEVARSGRFFTLPPAQSVDTGSSGEPSITILNRTAYSLTVMIDGPVQRAVRLAPGATETVAIPAGAYRVLGRVTVPNVLPFFGNQLYSTGSSYQESFYIK